MAATPVNLTLARRFISAVRPLLAEAYDSAARKRAKASPAGEL